MLWAVRYVLMICVLFLTACGQGPKASPGPALWVVEDSDNRIYLYGSFHMLPESLSWQRANLWAAMKNSELFYTELGPVRATPEEWAAISETYGQLPDGQTLTALLGEGGADKLDRLSLLAGEARAVLDRQHPWLVMLQIDGTRLTRDGYEGRYGPEQTIMARAREEGLSLLALESPERVPALLAALAPEIYIPLLEASLDGEDESGRDYEEAAEVWRRGDTATMAKNLAVYQAYAPELYHATLTRRNAAWAVTLDRVMRGDQNALVVVGASHLIGPDSLIAQLEALGYKVTRL